MLLPHDYTHMWFVSLLAATSGAYRARLPAAGHSPATAFYYASRHAVPRSHPSHAHANLARRPPDGIRRAGQCRDGPAICLRWWHARPLLLGPTAQRAGHALGKRSWRRGVRFENVATTREGTTVAMEIRNTTEYRPTRIANNGYVGGGTMFQLNLAPVSDPTADSNMVGLEYRFLDAATNTEVELEEFSISFFDFDQDWADGTKAYVRESLLISDFTTAFVTNDTAGAHLQRHPDHRALDRAGHRPARLGQARVAGLPGAAATNTRPAT